jgi:hypothetical protein
MKPSGRFTVKPPRAHSPPPAPCDAGKRPPLSLDVDGLLNPAVTDPVAEQCGVAPGAGGDLRTRWP